MSRKSFLLRKSFVLTRMAKYANLTRDISFCQTGRAGAISSVCVDHRTVLYHFISNHAICRIFTFGKTGDLLLQDNGAGLQGNSYPPLRGLPMTQTETLPLALGGILSAIRRHWRKAASVFAMVMLATAAFLLFAPREYRSHGKLFVRIGRENATLDSTATLGQSSIVAIPQSRENEINSVVEILQSRVLLERVVDALGPEKVAGVADRERAVERAAKRLSVEAAKRSSVIEVAYRGSSPALCQAVVSQLIDAYLDEHGRLNRPHGSYEFFTEQSRRLREELAHREKELRDLKGATGLASPAAQRQQMVARMGKIEDELLQAEAARAVAEAKVAEWRRQLSALPDTQITNETTGFNNEGTDRMREQFYALQVRAKEAQAKYTDDHPKMLQIHEQIAAARQILDQEERNRKQVTKEPGRLHQQAQAALLAEEPMLASLRVQSDQLKAQLASVRGDLTKLNEDEARIVAVQREVDLIEADYRKYAVNLEQARIDQQLETQRMSNISVVQPASYESRPISPRKGLILLLGLAAGVFGAAAVPLAFDGVSSPSRAAEEMSDRLGLPLLAVIPRVERKHSVQNREKVTP